MHPALFLAAVAFLPPPPAQEAKKLEPVWSRRLHFSGSAVGFSPDSATGAFGHLETGTIILHRVSNGKILRTLRQREGGRVESVAFSLDGKVLETRTTKYTEESASMAIRLWEVSTGKELFFTKVEGTFETFVKQLAVFSPDRKTLAQCSAAKRLRLLDVGTGKEIRTLPGHCSSIQFSPDGKRLASSDGDSVFLWDMATGKELGWRKWRGQEIQALQFNGDRLLVTTEEKTREQSPKTRLWDFAEPRRLIERPQFLPGPVSPDGTVLVALTGYGPCVGAFLQLWDLKTATEGAMVGLPNLFGSPPGFTANGKILLVVWSPPRQALSDSPQAHADVFAVPSGAHLRRITLPGGINAAAIAPDGQTVAAAGDKQCLVQRLALVSVRVVAEPPGFLSPNGGLLARADTAGKVQLLVHAGSTFLLLDGKRW